MAKTTRHQAPPKGTSATLSAKAYFASLDELWRLAKGAESENETVSLFVRKAVLERLDRLGIPK